MYIACCGRDTNISCVCLSNLTRYTPPEFLYTGVPYIFSSSDYPALTYEGVCIYITFDRPRPEDVIDNVVSRAMSINELCATVFSVHRSIS